ncbi:hypothetical protein ACFQ6S_41925 [Streptomyces sp. NPDC056479]|uniref:hypothetical protein n=1 Tax=Streptomyces sp. NPDC056479 TaxID=3345832 RepID=UPI00367D180C
MSTNLAERVANKRTDRSTAPAHPPAQQPTLVQFVQKLRPEIDRALPAHIGGADRIARIALSPRRWTAPHHQRRRHPTDSPCRAGGRRRLGR